MKNIKKNNLKIFIYLLFLALFIFSVAYFFYFPDLFTISTNDNDFNYPSTRLIQVDRGVLKDLGELKKCGDWPLNQISFNIDRGNPFTSKNSSNEIMTAVSEAQCLNVIKN